MPDTVSTISLDSNTYNWVHGSDQVTYMRLYKTEPTAGKNNSYQDSGAYKKKFKITLDVTKTQLGNLKTSFEKIATGLSLTWVDGDSYTVYFDSDLTWTLRNPFSQNGVNYYRIPIQLIES